MVPSVHTGTDRETARDAHRIVAQPARSFFLHSMRPLVCRHRASAFLAAIMAVALTVACGGGQGSDRADITPQDLRFEADEITSNHLSLMTLSLEDLGPDYSSFSLDPAESGSTSNADEIADDECDPEGEQSDIERFGRLNGYDSSYSSDSRLEAQSGVFTVLQNVSLYVRETGSLEAFRDDLAESREMVGVADCQGFTIFTLDEFSPAPPLGDESIGVVSKVGYEIDQFYFSVILFVRGPLYGWIGIADFDSTDHRAEIEALAQRLHERIEAVLRGEIEEISTSPVSSELKTRAEALELLPDLVLQAEDVPPGLSVIDSRVGTLDDLASQAANPARARRLLESWEFLLSYFRQYERNRLEGIFRVSVEVWGLADTDNAEEAFIDGALLSDYDEVQYEEVVPLSDFGDESVGYRLTGQQFDPSGAPFMAEGYEILIRVRNRLALLGIEAAEGQISQAEAESLATALESRMRNR